MHQMFNTLRYLGYINFFSQSCHVDDINDWNQFAFFTTECYFLETEGIFFTSQCDVQSSETNINFYACYNQSACDGLVNCQTHNVATTGNSGDTCWVDSSDDTSYLTFCAVNGTVSGESDSNNYCEDLLFYHFSNFVSV